MMPWFMCQSVVLSATVLSLKNSFMYVANGIIFCPVATGTIRSCQKHLISHNKHQLEKIINNAKNPCEINVITLLFIITHYFICNLAEARKLKQLYQDTMKSTLVPLRT